MKFSTALLTTIAPVALAKSAHSHYPKRSQHVAQEVTVNNGMHGFGIDADALHEVVIVWVAHGGNDVATTVNQQVTVTQTVTAGMEHATVVPGIEGSTTISQGATAVVPGMGATHSVTVGGPAGLSFTPDNVQANIGDMVIFSFFGQNHTATQSGFETPCDPLAGGMDSGFQPNPDNTIEPAPQVAMQVMVDTPLWFYCRQGAGVHCGKGMTFSINPTADKSQAMFQAMAIQQKGNGAGSAITGNGEAPPPVEDAPVADAPPPVEDAPVADAPAPVGDLPVVESLASLPALESNVPGAVATGTVDGVVQGTGTILADGTCACAVAIGEGSFPAVANQGVGNFGGVAGSLPANMAEIM